MKHKGVSETLWIIGAIIIVAVVILILLYALKSNIMAMSDKTTTTIKEAPSSSQHSVSSSGDLNEGGGATSNNQNAEYTSHAQSIAKTIDASSQSNSDVANQEPSIYLRPLEGKCGCYIVSCCVANDVIS